MFHLLVWWLTLDGIKLWRNVLMINRMKEKERSFPRYHNRTRSFKPIDIVQEKKDSKLLELAAFCINDRSVRSGSKLNK